MKKTPVTNEEKFMQQGQDWEADKTARIEKSERRAWMVAGCATVAALASVIGLAMLAPLKTTVPYLFAVDKATGRVELVDAVDDRTVVGYQELLDKHWATKYVIARESFYWKLLQHDYDTVLNLSADNVGQAYAAQYAGPDSRDRKLGPDTELKIKILSVTVTHDAMGSKAVIRYEQTKRNSNGQSSGEAPSYYVATMSYEYKPSMLGKQDVLIANPLGFKITAYRTDQELAQSQGVSELLNHQAAQSSNSAPVAVPVPVAPAVPVSTASQPR